MTACLPTLCRRTSEYFRRSAILFASLWVTACPSVHDAYKDRFADRQPTIIFGCDSHSQSDHRLTDSSVPIVVRTPIDPEPPTVGLLFEWATEGIPVRVTGKLPHTVLAADITQTLERIGCVVTRDSASAAVVLDAQITHLSVHQVPAKWYQMHGKVIGKIEVSLRLSRGSQVLWETKAVRSSALGVTYFQTADLELAINNAYCKAFAKLETDLRSAEFLASVRG